MASEDSTGPLPVRLLNDSYGVQVQHNQRFSLFPILPAELRVYIWLGYLRRHRIVGIDLHTESDARPDYGDGDGASQSSQSSEAPPLSLYSETNELGNLVSGQDYCVVLSRQHKLSPLLRVNAEARAVALSFYRLRIPCRSRREPSHNGHGHGHDRRVYINPEFDFVHVQLGPGAVRRGQAQGLPRPPPERLVDFLYDCKAYDPRDRGVLHLVVGNGDASRFQLPHEPCLVAPQALDAFTSTLVNLQTLYFYIRADAARIMATELIAGRIRYNRGVPMEARCSEDIEFLGNDPRRIEYDLRLVCVGDDPRASLWVWQEMLRSFGIDETATATTDVRFLLTSTITMASTDDDCTIRSRGDAKKYAQAEERRWQALFDKTTGPFRGMANPYSPAQVADAVYAAGFWLVDADAFGAMPERAGFFGQGPRSTTHRWDIKHDATLTAHRPQLGLFSLDP
ncbi:hypothetical protein SBRCBS47491_007301 [Sporothrix bragantina]|uniref:2EXR domain-containing protein n=1 Tax=Sporothrix bragantina TaxID=671064 RepID=A0ABP0CC33_9PEZI